MNQIALSDDLIEITAEINIWKQQAGQAVFEIGKRLKHVKENDLAHGQWTAWLESVDIEPRTAQRMMQAFEQFGDTTHASLLPTGKIFELLSLPESVDRNDFVRKEHIVPSTGESKPFDDLSRQELREVTKALKQAESDKEKLTNESVYYQKLWNQEKNKPALTVTKTVEVIPDHIKKQLEEKEFQLNDLRHGYKNAKEKLQQFELMNTVDFNEEQARKQREKMQHEADFNTLEVRVHINQFLEKVAITSYLQGALTAADPITKKKLFESVSMLEEFTNQIKSALNGRILGGIVNE